MLPKQIDIYPEINKSLEEMTPFFPLPYCSKIVSQIEMYVTMANYIFLQQFVHVVQNSKTWKTWPCAHEKKIQIIKTMQIQVKML